MVHELIYITLLASGEQYLYDGKTIEISMNGEAVPDWFAADFSSLTGNIVLLMYDFCRSFYIVRFALVFT